MTVGPFMIEHESEADEYLAACNDLIKQGELSGLLY